MGDLSFLPRELLRPRRRAVPRPARLAAVAAAAGLLGALAWHYAYAVSTYLAARAELQALDAERERIRWVRDLRQEVRAAEERLKRHEELVAPYRAGPGVRDALVALGRAVPQGLVLLRVQVLADRQVRLEGVAPTLSDVARLMVNLEASGYYAKLQARFPEPFLAGAAGGAREVAAAVAGASPAVRFEVYGQLQLPGGS